MTRPVCVGLSYLAEARPHGVEHAPQRGIQQAQLGFFSFRYALQETPAAAARALAEHQRTVMLARADRGSGSAGTCRWASMGIAAEGPRAVALADSYALTAESSDNSSGRTCRLGRYSHNGTRDRDRIDRVRVIVDRLPAKKPSFTLYVTCSKAFYRAPSKEPRKGGGSRKNLTPSAGF